MNPAENVRPQKGTYVILMEAATDGTVAAGKLGRFYFYPGTYAYIGSALGPGGVAARVGRHRRRPRARHWHIDYLQDIMRPLAALVSYSEIRREHRWANRISELFGALPETGFGASDCSCLTHLYGWKGLVPEPGELATVLSSSDNVSVEIYDLSPAGPTSPEKRSNAPVSCQGGRPEMAREIR